MLFINNLFQCFSHFEGGHAQVICHSFHKVFQFCGICLDYILMELICFNLAHGY